MSKPREFDLKHAREIIAEYSQPNSMIDEGNLFFALCEFQEAYDKAVSALKDILDGKYKYYATFENIGEPNEKENPSYFDFIETTLKDLGELEGT